MSYLGVDGCKAGWLAIRLEPDSSWSAAIFSDFESLVKTQGDFRLLLVDIPIGLRDTGPEERLCDTAARKILPVKLKPSVFRAPSRNAIYHSDYHKASIENFKHTGKKLSRQVWGIVPKIKEVDTYMRKHIATFAKRIKESHPEVCFHMLSSGKIIYPKSNYLGIKKRESLLQKIFPRTPEIIYHILSKYSLREVGYDDILDALVLAITSSISNKGLISIPENPEIDSFGLPMQILTSSGSGLEL